jgi:zinc transport system substrate-binding protein
MLQKNKIMYILLIALFSLTIFPAAAEDKIVATNSWTKAFVSLAGAESVQIASANMKHPPEYELKPSDVLKINNADFIVYAGYEVMMKTVFDSFKKPEDQLIKIRTSYVPAVLKKSVMKIASRTGTTKLAKKNITEYKNEFNSAVKILKEKGLYGAPVIVQFHLKPIIEALGFNILAVIGPAPLEASQIVYMSKLKPALIIDNAHNPVAAPIAEVTGATTIKLINFPGYPNDDGSVCPDSLIGVLKYNIGKLLE